MPKTKVVIIIKYFFPIKRPSGISSFVHELANALASDVDLTVVSYKKEKDNRNQDRSNGYDILKIKKPFPITAPKLVNKLNPDIVIIFSGIFKPIKTLFYFGLISILLKNRNQIFCQATNYNTKTLSSYYKLFLRQFKAIIATNDYLQQQYQNLGMKSVLITPGVNSTVLNQKTIEINKSKKVRIGFFGHFYQVKGPDRLLNASLKINPSNAEVIFAGGEGPLENLLKEQAKKDSRIIVIGWQKSIISLIASCDIVVLPYRNSYSVLGYSQAALEAMSLEIPVIGTKTPSLEFLIKDGYNGYIVKNDEELAKMLQYLIDNPAKRKELGINARQTIINDFDIKKIAKDYLNLLNENR